MDGGDVDDDGYMDLIVSNSNENSLNKLILKDNYHEENNCNRLYFSGSILYGNCG